MAMITKQRVFIDDELAIVVKVSHSSGQKDFSATAQYQKLGEEKAVSDAITDRKTYERNGWKLAVRLAVEAVTKNLRELDKRRTMEAQIEGNLESVVEEALENDSVPERFKDDS